MKKLFGILLMLFSAQLSFSQKVEIVHAADNYPLSPSLDFAFIEPAIDSSYYSFVATYRIISTKKKTGISTLFYLMQEQAKKDGANCFKLNSYALNDSTNEMILVLDTYYWADSVRGMNFGLHEMNCIYIFGDERGMGEEGKSVAFKVNGEKKTLQAGTYLKIQRKEEGEVKVNKGGFSGATAWFGKKGFEQNVFLSMSGFALGGQVPAGVAGIGFNTGRINKIPGDLGQLLVRIMKPAEE